MLVPAVLLYTLPLLVRRRFPFIAPAFVFAVQIAISFADPEAIGSLDTGSIAMLLTFWAVGERNDGQQAVAGLGLGLGTLAIITAEDARVDVEQAVNGALLYSLAWLFALLLARRSRRAAAAEARAVQLERDQEERGRAAAATERGRIARELHDVIAHSLSVMTVQAGLPGCSCPTTRNGRCRRCWPWRRPGRAGADRDAPAAGHPARRGPRRRWHPSRD